MVAYSIDLDYTYIYLMSLIKSSIGENNKKEGDKMMGYLKILKPFLIYQIIITLMISVIIIFHNDMGAFLFWFILVLCPISIISTFIAGPIFGFVFYLQYSPSIRQAVKYSLFVFIFNCITFSIPIIIYPFLDWKSSLIISLIASILFFLFSNPISAMLHKLIRFIQKLIQSKKKGDSNY